MLQEDKDMVKDTWDYLKTIPQMQHIMENLPDNITCVFSDDIPGIASYSSEDNRITIKSKAIDMNNPQERLSFCITLAHELCHANQKKEGLYYNDLSNSSFGDTFRVAKLMEADTRLLSVIVENELLKRDEFKGCTPSEDCLIYQEELRRANGDVEKANTNFVLAY